MTTPRSAARPILASMYTAAMHTFAVLALMALVYRLRLSGRLLAERAFDVVPTVHPRAYLLKFLLGDLLVAGAFALAVALLSGLVGLLVALVRRRARPLPRWARASAKAAGFALLAALSTLVAAHYQAHYSVLWEMRTGLTYDLLVEGHSGGWGTAAVGFLGLADWAFVGGPVLLLACFALLPRRWLRCRDALLGLLVLAAVVVNVAYLGGKSRRLVADLKLPPVWFTARDALRTLGGNPADWPKLPPRRAAPTSPPVAGHGSGRAPAAVEVPQQQSVRLVDPLLVRALQPRKVLPRRSDTRWNVLLVLMESTGTRYVFKKYRGKHAMPFVHQLAQQGLLLRNHYSPTNSSPRGIFALLSGLYPRPTLRIYAMSKGLRFPTMLTLLPTDYQTLMVTPGPLTWYFPRHFLVESGPQDLYHHGNIRPARNVPKISYARHEVDAASFFIERLREVQDQPFFAIYYSFVAHYPYPDFGPRFRRYRSQRAFFRYLNNLYLLDLQIRRFYDFLAREKLLRRTILVLLGDHGEAHGQHRRNRAHSRHSYNENFETPVIFYQPRLFRARVVKERTTHVDVLPTLFDAMGMPYNPQLVQGESLFQRQLRRRYLFLFGNENTLTSIDRRGIKLQVSFRSKRCWVYDLRSDPAERRRLSCRPHRQQHKATLYFKRYQTRLLRDYNRACSRGKAFFGQRHPPPPAPPRLPTTGPAVGAPAP